MLTEIKRGVTLGTALVLVIFFCYALYITSPIMPLLINSTLIGSVLCGTAMAGKFISRQITSAAEPWLALAERGQQMRLLTLQSELVTFQGTQVAALRSPGKVSICYVPREKLALQQNNELPQITQRRIANGIHIADGHTVDVDEVLSARKLIVGISGSGKSNSVGVLCEELARYGVPLILADTEDEYSPLASFLPNGLHIDSSQLNVDGAASFATYILEQGKQAIVNLQSFVFEEAAQIMIAIINGLKSWQEQLANESRIPCEFILEEATTWLPQNTRESPLHGTETFDELQSAFFNDLVRKGRKRGLGLTTVCQKIAEIDKRALQADVKILHRQTELPDLDRYARMGIEKEETLSLAKGECFFFSPSAVKTRLQIRKRNSPHGAHTPGLASLQNHSVAIGERIAEQNDWRAAPRAGSDEFVGSFGSPKARLRVPDELRTAILQLYHAGIGRKNIQAQLELNGDEYWMIKHVCDEYDDHSTKQQEQ